MVYGGTFSNCDNASDIQKLKESGWFGVNKTGGSVAHDESAGALKVSTTTGSASQKAGGVAGYVYKEGVAEGKHMYKLTFKVMRDAANLNTGFQVSCRANGNKRDFVISGGFKDFAGDPAQLKTSVGFTKAASAAGAWDTFEAYINFDMVRIDEKGENNGKLINATDQDKTCFEVRIFPKKDGATADSPAVIFIKDFELSEVIHPAVKLP